MGLHSMLLLRFCVFFLFSFTSLIFLNIFTFLLWFFLFSSCFIFCLQNHRLWVQVLKWIKAGVLIVRSTTVCLNSAALYLCRWAKVQFCTLLKVRIRLYGRNRDLNIFTTSLHLEQTWTFCLELRKFREMFQLHFPKTLILIFTDLLSCQNGEGYSCNLIIRDNSAVHRWRLRLTVWKKKHI
jgi:hypothetical protein